MITRSGREGLEMKDRLQSDVLVPLSGMADFDVSLARLNKKAQSFGLDPIKVIACVPQRYYWDVEEQDSGYNASMVRLKAGEEPPFGQAVSITNRLSLDYPTIKLGEWSVVGQIEATKAGNLLFSVSSDPDDAVQMSAHATCPINCEHCNTKRARKLSFLLKNDASQYKEVGSTCLEDFTGIDPAAALFMQKMHVFWSDYGDEPVAGGMGRVTSMPVRGYIARVLFCMEENKGFVTSGMSRENGLLATYAHASSLDEDFRYDTKIRDRFYQSYERHAEYAQQVIDWWKQSDGDDAYSHNVRLLFAADDIELKSKHLAFAAGAVPGYQRHLSQKEVTKTVSVHVGEIGEKREDPLTLRSIADWETQFGRQWRFNFTDSTGNRMTWRTSSPPPDLLQPQAIGSPLVARFKVKKHDEYKDIATTEMSHLKVTSWPEAENSTSPSIAVITVRPDTSAFADIGLRDELENIVRNVAKCLDHDLSERVEVRDINGNSVGAVSLDEPTSEVAADSIRISIQIHPGQTISERAEFVAQALLAGKASAESISGELVGAIELGTDILVLERSVPQTELSAVPAI